MLEAARAAVASVRYSRDDRAELAPVDERMVGLARSLSASSGVAITPALLPRVHRALKQACERLRLEPSSVHGFVHASSDLQAACYSGGGSSCVVQVGSALVQFMQPEELCFVLGHELGHFLFGHGEHHRSGSGETLERAISQRAGEISADRVGLLGCPSLESALRAIMKTAAGLGDEHFRFDVGAFLAQIRHLERPLGTDWTHLSLLVRCRALVWFSLSREYRELSGETPSGTPLKEVDERIARELDRYVDGPARKLIAEARDEVRLWLLVTAAVQEGRLSKRHREIMQRWIESETVEKISRFLGGQTRAEAEETAREKLRRALSSYCGAAPREAGQLVPAMIGTIAEDLKCPQLRQVVSPVWPV